VSRTHGPRLRHDTHALTTRPRHLFVYASMCFSSQLQAWSPSHHITSDQTSIWAFPSPMTLYRRVLLYCTHGGAKYCDEHVCLSVHSLVLKTTPKFQKNFLWMLSFTMARSVCDGTVIRYVLPVLWKTFCFHIMEGIGPNASPHASCYKLLECNSGHASNSAFWHIHSNTVTSKFQH